MELTRHCDLCDHHRTRFKDGIICGLTERKPEFSRVCSKSKYDTELTYKLKKVNFDYQVLQKLRWEKHVKFIAAIALALSLVGVGLWLLLTYGVALRSPLYISLSFMGSALVPLFVAFNDFVNYKQEMAQAKKKKDQIDEVLNLYRIRYDIDFKFDEIFTDEYEITAKVTIHQ
jgi:hypothetical protein